MQARTSPWFFLGMAVMVILTFFEADEILYPVRQDLRCEAEQCVHQRVQLHPILFWQNERNVFSPEEVEASSLDVRYGEWELEVAGKELLFVVGRDRVSSVEDAWSAYQLGSSESFVLEERHRWVGFIQWCFWLLLLSPLYLLVLDLSGRPRETYSLYADGSMLLIKRYNLLGVRIRQSFGLSQIRTLEASEKRKKEKGHERSELHLKLIEQSGKTRWLFKGISGEYISEDAAQAYEQWERMTQALNGFIEQHKKESQPFL